MKLCCLLIDTVIIFQLVWSISDFLKWILGVSKGFVKSRCLSLLYQVFISVLLVSICVWVLFIKQDRNVTVRLVRSVCKLHYSLFYVCLHKMNPLLVWQMKQWTPVHEFLCMCRGAVAVRDLTVTAWVHACWSLCVVPTTSLWGSSECKWGQMLSDLFERLLVLFWIFWLTALTSFHFVLVSGIKINSVFLL